MSELTGFLENFKLNEIHNTSTSISTQQKKMLVMTLPPPPYCQVGIKKHNKTREKHFFPSLNITKENNKEGPEITVIVVDKF